MDTIAIREDQIWREDDKRFKRFVRVTRVYRGSVTFRTCDESGGGYKLVWEVA